MTTSDAPPRWDLTPIFGSLDDRAFSDTLEGVYAQIARLAELYDELDIHEGAPRAATAADVAGLESVLEATNEVQADLRRLSAFLYALTSTDSRDDRAAARQVELQTRTAPLAPLSKRLGSWLAALGIDDLTEQSSAAGEHEF